MALIVADSDVLIDALRGREPASSRIAEGLSSGALATTSVSAFELLSGGRTAAELATIELLLAALSILPFDHEASKAAAAARRDLEARDFRCHAILVLTCMCMQVQHGRHAHDGRDQR